MAKKRISPSYSGEKSFNFWHRVNAIASREQADFVYFMGCCLQDLESRTLQALSRAEEAQRPNAKKDKA